MNYFVLSNQDDSLSTLISCSASLDALPEGFVQVTAEQAVTLRAQMDLELNSGSEEPLPEPA